MASVEEVLAFWLDEVGPDGWYGGGDALDQTCRDRFMDTWEHARDGGLSLWLTHPSGVLAYSIVTDQLPRNMFREDGRAFALDPVARAATKVAISREWDMRIDAPARQFFYLPLMHSENLSDQEQCIRLFYERMPEAEDNLLHARAHREVIRRFGRFPHRNEMLERDTPASERRFIDDGGYGAVVREMQAAA